MRRTLTFVKSHVRCLLLTLVDPGIVLAQIWPLANPVRYSIRDERLVAGVATAIGTLALVLAVRRALSVDATTALREE